MNTKELYLIGGSNGAGKTTFAREFLPRYIDCPRFINPDLIAAGLSPFDPDAVAARAGRMVLEEIQSTSASGKRFAFESTLSGRVYSRILRTAKEHGYWIHLFYLWVPDPLLALARIRDRVDSGGHNVPEADVRRRYGRTLYNFFNLYRQTANTVHFFDNSSDEPQLVFKDADGQTEVYNRELYDTLVSVWRKA